MRVLAGPIEVGAGGAGEAAWAASARAVLAVRARAVCAAALLLASLATLALLTASALLAQPANAQPRGASPAEPPAPPPSPRESAPIDLTGQWVAIVNEDWRWRMVTPPKGDYASVPLNDEGRRVADEWDPARDGACEAYGAAALLRMPTRLRIEWQGADVLVIETDAGAQTRRLLFDGTAAPGAPSLQGHSVAEWVRPLPPPGGPGLAGAGGGAARMGGHLRVITTNLLPGWLRRNGVPYSGDALVTEHFDRFAAPNGDEWLMVTTIVEDPTYLTQRFITSSHFKRETDRSKWNPRPCRA